MTVVEQIARRLREAPAGWAFTPKDLLQFGTPHAVGMALNRMLRAGRVRRIGRGLYDVPRTHPKLGVLGPSHESVAQAIARRDGIRIRPSGGEAANLLGLSEQVPARVVYDTDGPSRSVRVGRLEIQFRHRRPRVVRNSSDSSALVIAALRDLGRAHVTRERIAHLRLKLPPKSRRQLLEDLSVAPVWMHPHLRFIAGDSPASVRTQSRRKPAPTRERKG